MCVDACRCTYAPAAADCITDVYPNIGIYIIRTNGKFSIRCPCIGYLLYVPSRGPRLRGKNKKIKTFLITYAFFFLPSGRCARARGLLHIMFSLIPVYAYIGRCGYDQFYAPTNMPTHSTAAAARRRQLSPVGSYYMCTWVNSVCMSAGINYNILPLVSR